MREVATTPWARWGPWLPLAAGVALYGAFAHRLFGFTPDDTFIFLQYARNWVEGAGPVFNPGEAVQGYTSTLWLAWLALATRLARDPLLAAKLSSAALGLVLVVTTYRLAREVSPQRRIPLAPLLLVGFLDVPYWAVSGMDTVPFAAIVNLALLAYLVSWRAPRAVVPAAILLALAGWARPEGALVTAAVGVYEWHRTAHRPSRLFVWSIAVAAIAIAGQYAWALAEYGSLLPNTYFAKHIGWPGNLAGGSRYLRGFLEVSSGAFLLLLATAALLDDRGGRAVRFLAVISGVLVAYIVWVGGDSWGWLGTQRFFVPLAPAMAVLMDAGIGWLSALARPRLATRRGRLVAAAGGVAAVAAFLNPTGIGARPVTVVGGDRELATYLRSLARPDDAVVASDVGQLGYYGGLRVIDTYGLVSRFPARELHKTAFQLYTPESTARLVEHLLAEDARFVVLKGTLINGTQWIADECGAIQLFNDPRFARRYRFLRAARQPYLLFVRRGGEPGEAQP